MRVSKRKTLKIDDLNHSLRFYNFKVIKRAKQSLFMGMTHLQMLNTKEWTQLLGYGGQSRM
jgi:hypothetical protein